MINTMQAFYGFLNRWNLSRNVEVIIRVKSIEQKDLMEKCIHSEHDRLTYVRPLSSDTGMNIYGIPLKIEVK